MALRAKVDSGQRILALSLKELVRRFSLHMEEQVRQGQIAVKTWQSQRYRIALGCDFLKTIYPAGLDTKDYRVKYWALDADLQKLAGAPSSGG